MKQLLLKFLFLIFSSTNIALALDQPGPLRLNALFPNLTITSIPDTLYINYNINRWGEWGSNDLTLYINIPDPNDPKKLIFKTNLNVSKTISDDVVEIKSPKSPKLNSDFKVNFILKYKKQTIDQKSIHYKFTNSNISFNQKGFLTLNNQPFFPIGLYMAGHDNDEDLKRISEAGFNFLISYKYGSWGFDGTKISNQDMFDYFTRANKYNLKVALNIVNYFPWSDTYICNVVKNLCPNTLPDNYILDLFMKSINTYPNPSPVILLYLNDEQRKPEQLPKIFETYNYIKSHYTIPVMQTMMLDSKQTLEKNSMFLKPFSRTSDILSVDPYPIGFANEPISAVSSQAKALNIAQNNMKPYMIINQLHGGSNYFTESPPCKNINCNDPTYIQQKNMVYQSLINNAKGIVLYSYFDLFKENNKMLSEQQFLEKWKPVSLLGLELKNLSNILMQGKDLENSNTNNLKYRVIQYNKKLYILVCNVTSSPQTISLKINKSFKNISLISDANIQTKLKSKYFGLSKSVNITILPLGSGYIVIN